MSKLKIIAEIGSVHDGSFGNAIKAIELSKKIGVDAVKFQTHIADCETLPDAPMPSYFKGEPRLEYFRRTAFSEKQWIEIGACCRENKIEFISSPFAIEAIDVLEKAGIETYKIPSGEITNIPLLRAVNETGKPVIISSGMSDWKELDAAIDCFSSKHQLSVLQCTSEYPCPPHRVGLNVIQEMKERYGISTGLSDHTLGMAAGVAAVALGASIIEKHLTFSRDMYGSDAANSMEPNEFSMFVEELRKADVMIRNPVIKNDSSSFHEMKMIFEKSIVTKCAIPAGIKLSQEHLSFKKPGDGISASDVDKVIGCITGRSLESNAKIKWEDLK